MQDLSIIYHETQAALKGKHHNAHIYYFDDLELESLLFQIENVAIVDRFVKKELGALLAADKEHDLAKTLFTYIECGMNINNTSKVLSMSISGLRYRLAKISDTLNVELDDTKRLFSIYMAMKILRVQGQLSFD